MKPSEVKRFLRDNGYIEVRNGKKHHIYEKKGHRIVVSHGSHSAKYRVIKLMKALIKRGKRKSL